MVRIGIGLVAAVALLATSAAARAADDDGVIEGELLQIDAKASNLLLAELLSGRPTVIGIEKADFFLQGEQPISLRRVPEHSDLRVLYRAKHGRRVAERIDVFPHSVPDVDWGRARPRLQARASERVQIRLTADQAPAVPPDAASGATPICPPGTRYVGGYSSASSPGTVLPGGGTAIGGSHSTSTPGDPNQPAQPAQGCVPEERRAAPTVLP